ncbi:hypothetical protein LTR56_021102 [Elasticomyces elasticus]|nr:hypothetical protein LTR56_021102 [Elasticomyces elasticus]KAK3631914.1 hypothetical protein LTR22_020847 [Elasticomyces elasticus]KAK4909720.1 hypothetical protein LTR49_021532 [Elasticomyces elasticus]KAK5749576.1 hypothetical protein LTS12_020363 [Elasticomyces elasticus]
MNFSLLSIFALIVDLVSALPTINTAALVNDGNTTALDFITGLVATRIGPNTTTHMASTDNPVCFNCGYGVKGDLAAKAILALCQEFSGMETRFQISGTIPYAATPDTTEQGIIMLEVSVPPNNGCWTQTIDLNDCVFNMWTSIDGCNTDGSDGKQGGTVDTGCLAYTVNPNPEGC